MPWPQILWEKIDSISVRKSREKKRELPFQANKLETIFFEPESRLAIQYIQILQFWDIITQQKNLSLDS